MDKNLTAKEKRQARYQTWINAEGVPFKSPEAKAKYQARVKRFIDVVELEKVPDRVPIFPLGTFLQSDLYGITPGESMYDYQKMLSAQMKFLNDYDPDFYGSPSYMGSGKIFDILGLTLYRWPRHGVDEKSGYQCVEGEYMRADEYQALIDDPSDFWLRTFIPRIFSSLAPLANIAPFPHLWEIVGISGQMIPFGIPEVQKALQALIDAGSEAMNWIKQINAFEMEARSLGYPTLRGGAAKAPFDILADTMRGTRGMMMDLFRQPEMIVKAMERLVPIYINQGVSMANRFGSPVVFMPLHKGADGFMSDHQFKTYYWPTLKAVILGLVEEGCVPYLFCEGSFNTRLDYLKELPKGSCFWIFDRTDMAKAKETIGDTLCIGGNVPAGLILTGSPAEIQAYCKTLIDVAGRGGGYIMTFGSSMDEGNAENIHAMFDFSKEYGVYR
jgi:hypothetical protein